MLKLRSAVAMMAMAWGVLGCAEPLGSDLVQDHSHTVEVAFPGRAPSWRQGRLLADVAPEPPVIKFGTIDGHRVFEGDILLDDAIIEPTEAGTARQALAVTSASQRRWPGGIIPYAFDGDFAAHADAQDALAAVEAATSLRFVPRTTEADFVRFVDGAGCSSYVGRIGGGQAITLAPQCGLGAAIHEVLHAAGAWHEQQRLDRDAHVTVVYENIDPVFVSNFDPYIATQGMAPTPYDLGSIMHYGSFAFSKNGKPTIVRASDGQTYVHNRAGLSALDVEGVQSLYAQEACGCPAGKTCTTDGGCAYFLDVPLGSTHADDIDKIFEQGITHGCGVRRYCPTRPVTRAQMASFLTRALSLTPRTGTHFTDVVPHNSHAKDIYAIFDAGITQGCGPTTYCPDAPVTRAQMASFLVRALTLPPAHSSPFTDIEGSTHAADIRALAAAGITKGCGPTSYCPDQAVTRAQMATFLVRALGL